MTNVPNTIELPMRNGIAALAAGDYPGAIHGFGQVLAIDPRHMGALVASAGALAALARYEEAEDFLERALALDPRCIDALICRGIIAGDQRRDAAAEVYFERVLAIDPQHVVALVNRAAALVKLNRHREALSCFERVVAIEPGHVDALVSCGRTLSELHRHDRAIAVLDRALARAPDRCDALLCRALALGSLERHEEALACLDRVLALEPDRLDALLNRGVALGKLHRREEALVCFEHALAIDPACAEALDGRGFALAKLKRHREALACLDHALTIAPGLVQTRYNRALIRLASGDLPGGFADFESRWASSDLLKDSRLKTAAPLWLGDAPLHGKTILLHHEQGFGDTLQFARYVPLVARRGGRVVLRVPRVLHGLLRTLPGNFEIISEADPLPHHDFHCPLMSLPLAFGTTLATIPAELPYLRADSACAATWKLRMGPRTRVRVGIVWAGRQYPPIDDLRDMPLATMQPLLDANASFISLQKDVPKRDHATLAALPALARCGESAIDFADSAGLVANLDLVIAVDTSVAHLAGALGKPVWILNRYASCWRWFLDRADSPWYPTARLFRQKTFGDWNSVIAEARQALDAFIETLPFDADRSGPAREASAIGLIAHPVRRL